MISWFQAFAFRWVNLYRYTELAAATAEVHPGRTPVYVSFDGKVVGVMVGLYTLNAVACTAPLAWGCT